MHSDIHHYLRDDEKMTDTVSEQVVGKLQRHPDILNEFAQWVSLREFPTGAAAVSVEGYTAESLVKSTYLRPVGAYNYLVYLRESPQEALDDLKKGLPRK